MTNEKRLIDANLAQHIADAELTPDEAGMVQWVLSHTPTVDAVPVNEIRVDFKYLCLVNQEAVLSVSICGKPNEVKLPFSKEVAEVVHGRWENHKCTNCEGAEPGYYDHIEDCIVYTPTAFCPNCGAAMKEVTP